MDQLPFRPYFLFHLLSFSYNRFSLSTTSLFHRFCVSLPESLYVISASFTVFLEICPSILLTFLGCFDFSQLSLHLSIFEALGELIRKKTCHLYALSCEIFMNAHQYDMFLSLIYHITITLLSLLLSFPLSDMQI